MIQLRFDFEGEKLLFTKPLQILKTERLDEVGSILEKVENARRSGFYVAGYIRYETAAYFQNLHVKKTANRDPLVWFGVFNKPVQPTDGKDQISPLSFQMDVSFAQYTEALTRIKAEIAAGNTYQVNYTTRLQAQMPEDISLDGIFSSLTKSADVAYAAHLTTDEHDILSISPELFFKKVDNKLTTRPMKGTAQRSQSEGIDSPQFEWLKNDPKNRAENVMIVDLLRNDLGRVATPGSVSVDKLCQIEAYPTVWQMTSTITAETPPQTTLLDLLTALFPCGSITGAPKASTMALIAEIEKSPRGVYCGAIGYLTPNDKMIFSVPIRTLEIDQKTHKAVYGVGGGIVWDSDIAAEFAEVHAKARVLEQTFPSFHLIESLRLENGKLLRMERHLDRLERSATKLAFQFDREMVREKWLQKAEKAGSGLFKFRCELTQNGDLILEYSAIDAKNPPLTAQLAVKASEDHPLAQLKTTSRTHYEKMRNKETAETLLFRTNGELLEFITGNVVLQFGTELVTPLSDWILPGIFREELLANGTIITRKLVIADLANADRIWLINSVREFVEIVWH